MSPYPSLRRSSLCGIPVYIHYHFKELAKFFLDTAEKFKLPKTAFVAPATPECKMLLRKFAELSLNMTHPGPYIRTFLVPETPTNNVDRISPILDNLRPRPQPNAAGSKQANEDFEGIFILAYSNVSSNYKVVESITLLAKESKHELMSRNMFWVLHDGSSELKYKVEEETSGVRKFLEQIRYDSNIFILKDFNKTGGTLVQVIKGKTEDLKSRESISRWSPKRGFTDIRDLMFKNLFGAHLKILFLVDEPFIYYKNASDQETLKYGVNTGKDYKPPRAVDPERLKGYLMDLLTTLSVELSFNYTLYDSLGMTYGLLQADGNWTGMIKHIVSKDYDLPLTWLIINPSRAAALEFAHTPLLAASTKVFIKSPEASFDQSWTAVFKSLAFDSWMTTMVFILFVGGTIWMTNRFSPLSARYLGNLEKNHNDIMYICDGGFWSWGAFLQQGHHGCPVEPSSRIVLASWALATLIIFNFYTANLFSFLAVRRVTLPGNSLEDLAMLHSWTFYFVDGTNPLGVMQRATTSPHKELYASGKVKTVPNYKEGIELVRTQADVAFIGSEVKIHYELGSSCEVTGLPSDFVWNYNYLPLQKHSEYVEAIDEALSRMYESGLMNRQLKSWWPRQESCSAGTGSSALGVDELTGIYIVLVAGTIIALLEFIAECVIYPLLLKMWLKRKHSNKKQEITTPITPFVK